MDAGTAAVIGLCALLVAWYGAGRLYNRGRGQRLFQWLEAGLDVLGGERETGWIGSPASGARVNVTHAASPFRRLEITLLLENREVPLLWLVDRLRGRPDRMVIRGTLRSPRKGELEVAPARRLATPRRGESRTRRDGPHGLTLAYEGKTPGDVAPLETWLETYGAYLDRLVWRKTDPHVQLQVNLAGLLATPSRTFLADLRAFLETAIKT